MAADTPASQPSEKNRREYYRITVMLPIRIQLETAQTEGKLIQESVNISGGIGVAVATVYHPDDVLAVTLILLDHGLFNAFAEVLRLDPLQSPGAAYLLHARFIRMSSQEQEVLISCGFNGTTYRHAIPLDAGRRPPGW